VAWSDNLVDGKRKKDFNLVKQENPSEPPSLYLFGRLLYVCGKEENSRENFCNNHGSYWEHTVTGLPQFPGGMGQLRQS